MKKNGIRRSWRRRVLIGFNVLLASLLVAGVSTIGYTKWRFNQITKVDLGNVLSGDTAGPKNPMTVLLVGSDSRAHLAPGEAKSLGGANATPGLSDTMMLLHIEPATQRASILSLPRDTWVTLAGSSGHGKLNAAFAGGGVEGITRLIKTIKQNFGVQVDHYAQVDFDGFKGIVDAIGGVQIPFAAPARDWGYDEASNTIRNLSGLDIKTTGCVNLNGGQALSYARSRHYQAFESGRWIADPQSDITRIQRQQDFVRRLMRKMITKASSNPLALNSLAATGVKNLTIDKTFTLDEITQLAGRFKSLDASKVEMLTLPVKGQTLNGASVVVVQQPATNEMISRFLNKSGTTGDNGSPAVPKGSISLRVLNGSGVAGQASATASQLRNEGFVVLGAGDGQKSDVTTIRYSKGQKDKADVLALEIGDVTEVEDATLRGVDLILTTGKSFSWTGSADSTDQPQITSTTSTTSTPSSTVVSSTTTTKLSKFVPDPTNAC